MDHADLDIELKRSPRPPSRNKGGLLLREGGGKGREGEGRGGDGERKGRGRKGKGMGGEGRGEGRGERREGKGKDDLHPTLFLGPVDNRDLNTSPVAHY